MKAKKDLNLKDLEKIRNMTPAALKKEIVVSEKTFFSLKMKKQAGELKQTHLMRFARKYIAQLRTIANEK